MCVCKDQGGGKLEEQKEGKKETKKKKHTNSWARASGLPTCTVHDTDRLIPVVLFVGSGNAYAKLGEGEKV